MAASAPGCFLDRWRDRCRKESSPLYTCVFKTMYYDEEGEDDELAQCEEGEDELATQCEQGEDELTRP